MLNTTVKNMSLAVAFLMLGSVLAIAQQGAPQVSLEPVVERSLTGTVTCSGRITHHYVCQRNQTLQSCTLACVQQGSDFVLMVGNKPYSLEGDRSSLERFAGRTATVAGLVTNDGIHVQAVSNAKRNSSEKYTAENRNR